MSSIAHNRISIAASSLAPSRRRAEPAAWIEHAAPDVFTVTTAGSTIAPISSMTPRLVICPRSHHHLALRAANRLNSPGDPAGGNRGRLLDHIRRSAPGVDCGRDLRRRCARPPLRRSARRRLRRFAANLARQVARGVPASLASTMTAALAVSSRYHRAQRYNGNTDERPIASGAARSRHHQYATATTPLAPARPSTNRHQLPVDERCRQSACASNRSCR